MDSRSNARRLPVVLGVCTAALLGISSAHAEEFKPDCTDPAVNEYFRTQISRANRNGEPLVDGVTLSVEGAMQPIAKNGAKLTCQARVRVTVQDGSSALRSTTVYLTVRAGEIEHIDFVMAPNRK